MGEILGEMAEVTCPKCRDIGVVHKDDPAKAYVCDCQVGKQWKIEPRGAQFRRVEEQQKVIERYRSALEAILALITTINAPDNCRCETEIKDIATNAIKELK